MSDFTQALSIAASGMNGQASRIRHVSENIANADTPGYRRKVVGFEAEIARGRATGAVETTGVSLDRTPLQVIHAPGHPLADENGNYEGSNVDLVIEIADAREAQRSYEANLRVFEQVRQMSSSLNQLLRGGSR